MINDGILLLYGSYDFAACRVNFTLGIFSFWLLDGCRCFGGFLVLYKIPTLSVVFLSVFGICKGVGSLVFDILYFGGRLGED